MEYIMDGYELNKNLALFLNFKYCTCSAAALYTRFLNQ